MLEILMKFSLQIALKIFSPLSGLMDVWLQSFHLSHLLFYVGSPTAT